MEFPKYGELGHRTTGNLYLSLMQAAGMKTPETFGQPDSNLKDLNLGGGKVAHLIWKQCCAETCALLKPEIVFTQSCQPEGAELDLPTLADFKEQLTLGLEAA